MFTVARYNGSGIEDSAFAGTGFAKIAPAGGPAEARAYAIAVDSNGYIVVAGVVDNATYPTGAFGVIRLTPGGLPDPAFNGGAMFVTQLGIGADTNPVAYYKPFFAVTVDSSNRPIVVGTALQAGTTTIGVLRLTTAGAADSGFGSSGKVSTALPGCADAYPTGVQIDQTGRLFVSAQCSLAPSLLTLVHYNANGSLDSAYGTGGYETEQFGTNAGAMSLVLDALGRPIDVGFDYRPANKGFSAFVINRHDYVFSHGFE